MRRHAIISAVVAACRGSSPEPAPAPRPAPIPAPPADAAAPRPRAQPPFAFATGSPRELFAGDKDLLARWAQRVAGPGWGEHADVAGGPGDEWLVDVGHYALVVSDEARGFWYRDFHATGEPTGLDARPLAGGPKSDVIATYDLDEGTFPTGYRHEILEVWSFGADGPEVKLAVELGAAALCCGSEANAPPHTGTTVALHDDSIELTPDKPWRVDPREFAPHTPAGVEPAATKHRTYRWNGTRFVASD